MISLSQATATSIVCKLSSIILFGINMTMNIDDIRTKIAEMGNVSVTTIQFQDDLLRYGREFAAHGNCLIEVGCYRGGMSAQFAALARELGQVLHVVDIDPGYMQVARETIEATEGSAHTIFHLMNFSSFAATIGPHVKPTLVLIDGDHYYNGVVSDIRALYAMPSRPFAAAFHDYSLRYAHAEGSDIRVDRALFDTLGADFGHVKIGEIARVGGMLRLHPEEDHHYHESGVSEGVLIKLADNTLVMQD